mmetsp:Transcript_11696/g.13372  ORF Transcript_11696/g.13372 Transcript_11696/m.13372 type:complete len:122 (+) Transcript_11696:808-1173(+)
MDGTVSDGFLSNKEPSSIVRALCWALVLVVVIVVVVVQVLLFVGVNPHTIGVTVAAISTAVAKAIVVDSGPVEDSEPHTVLIIDLMIRIFNCLFRFIVSFRLLWCLLAYLFDYVVIRCGLK